MASPDGLRLMLGRRLPEDAAAIIFAYGFHLWLARPHDRDVSVKREKWTLNNSSVIHGVKKSDLSERACKLVDYEKYWQKVILSRLYLAPGWALRMRISPLTRPYCTCGNNKKRSCGQCQVFGCGTTQALTSKNENDGWLAQMGILSQLFHDPVFDSDDEDPDAEVYWPPDLQPRSW